MNDVSYLSLTNGTWSKSDTMSRGEHNMADFIAVIYPRLTDDGLVTTYEVIKNRRGPILILCYSEEQAKALAQWGAGHVVC